MVDARPVVVLIIIALVVIFLVYTVFLSKPATKKTPVPTYQTPSSTNSSSNITPPPNITSKSATVRYYDVNVEYQYSGPASINNTKCTYGTFSYIDSTSLATNGTTPFELYFTLTTTGCPLQISSISVDTPGFFLSGTEPQLPINMAPNSQLEMQMDLVTPPISYYGPLTVTLYDN